VSPDIPGAADLDAYGEWEPETEYGAIWYPREVPADWVPYHYGHWVSRDPWGWVWVEDEPWGYAPFHYGRWVFYRDRWGWVPGPVRVRPVWSPALVVFAGGVGGGGVSAWFALGPGEAYRPWYRCSPRYIDQVNITNIREAPRVQVQRTYVNIVNVTNVTNITYVNQSRGITAMRHEDFASGRDARTAVVRVDPRQLQHVQPLLKPDVAPTQQSIVTRPAAHPVRVSAQRPMLINQQGNMIAARPGATPVEAPVRPAPPVKPVPGRTVIATPAHPNPAGPVGRPVTPAPVQHEQRNPNQQQPSPYPGGRPMPTPQRPAGPQNRPVPMEPQDRPAPPDANQPPQRYSNPPANPQQEQRNPNQPAPYPGGRLAPTPQRPAEPQYRPAPPNAVPQQEQRNLNPPQERPQPPQRTEPAPPPQRPESRPAPPPPNRQEYAPPQNRQERQPPPPKNDDKSNKEKQDNKKPHD
jgi:hypothetical protein